LVFCWKSARTTPAYVASWLKALKNDKKAIFVASSHAQKAADLLYAYQAAPPPLDPSRGRDLSGGVMVNGL
jgi:antirestriction protein ArdC